MCRAWCPAWLQLYHPAMYANTAKQHARLHHTYPRPQSDAVYTPTFCSSMF
jgi:hypothetical protein